MRLFQTSKRIEVCAGALAMLLMAFLLSCASLLERSSGSSRAPNVIVIVADDLGFSDLSALGSEVSTPHIDALAEQGMLFTNFHVAATCSPTRAMLISGSITIAPVWAIWASS